MKEIVSKNLKLNILREKQMSNLNNEQAKQKKGLGRGLGSLLGAPGQEPAGQQSSLASQLNTQSIVKNNQELQINNKDVDTMNTQMGIHKSEPIQQPQQPPVPPELRIWKVAVDKLQSGKYQPRKTFEKDKLAELAQSIKENGILQPIVARRTATGKLEIIAGERRWRAAQAAGLHEVPVILKSYEDKEALELAIIENVQREDLNPIEEAEGYQRLISEFHLSQLQVAEKVGKDRATVANAVRLLSLSTEVRSLVAENLLSVGHAKVLLAVTESSKQTQLAKRVIAEKIPVRKLEKLIRDEEKSANDLSDIQPVDHVKAKLVDDLCEQIQKALSTKVSIDYSQGKGKINIYFYSDEELSDLADKLRE